MGTHRATPPHPCSESARSVRRTLLLLALTFLVFGISDVVEAATGAWWQPWWLGAMKVACVVTLFLGFRRYGRLAKASDQRIERRDGTTHGE